MPTTLVNSLAKARSVAIPTYETPQVYFLRRDADALSAQYDNKGVCKM